MIIKRACLVPSGRGFNLYYSSDHIKSAPSVVHHSTYRFYKTISVDTLPHGPLDEEAIIRNMPEICDGEAFYVTLPLCPEQKGSLIVFRDLAHVKTLDQREKTSGLEA